MLLLENLPRAASLGVPSDARRRVAATSAWEGWLRSGRCAGCGGGGSVGQGRACAEDVGVSTLRDEKRSTAGRRRERAIPRSSLRSLAVTRKDAVFPTACTGGLSTRERLRRSRRALPLDAKKEEAGGAMTGLREPSQKSSCEEPFWLLLVGAVLLLVLLEDPGVDPVGDLGHQRQVVAAEARESFHCLPSL